MFCVTVSRLDSLGLILKNLDSTKLKLLPAVMCSSDTTMWGRISSAFWEWSGTAAEEHYLTKCPNAIGWMSQGFSADTTMPELSTKFKASVLELRKTGRLLFPSETVPLTLIIKCLRALAEFFSLRDHRSFLAEMGESRKQRCSHHHADFGSISHRTHPSVGDKT